MKQTTQASDYPGLVPFSLISSNWVLNVFTFYKSYKFEDKTFYFWLIVVVVKFLWTSRIGILVEILSNSSFLSYFLSKLRTKNQES